MTMSPSRTARFGVMNRSTILTGTVALLCPLSGGAQDTASEQAIEREAVEVLLAAQDRAFKTRDWAQLFGDKAWIHRDAQLRFARILKSMSASTQADISRRTKLVHLQQRGAIAVAHTVSTYCYSCRPGSETIKNYVLLLERGEDGNIAVRSQLEFDNKLLRDRFGSSEFQCAGCNYSIDAPKNRWLLVPQPAHFFGGMESIAYYALDADLSIQIVVRTDPGPTLEAAALLDRWVMGVTDRTRQTHQDAEIEPWLPEGIEAVDGMSGAKVRLNYARPDKSNERASVFHLLSLGDLQYLIDVHGSSDALERHLPDTREILNSFRLLDTDLTAQEMAVRARRRMAKGKLVGNVYTNERCHVRFEAPSGWEGSHHGSSDLFEVYFSKAEATLGLHGLNADSTAAADRVLEHMLAEHPDAEVAQDSRWHALHDGEPGYRPDSAEAGCEIRTVSGNDGQTAFCVHMVFRPEHHHVVVLEARGPDMRTMKKADALLRRKLSFR